MQQAHDIDATSMPQRESVSMPEIGGRDRTRFRREAQSDPVGSCSRAHCCSSSGAVSLLLVAVFAAALLHERPSLREWAGITMVGAGVLVCAIRR
jgi:hypothetical protein